MVIVGLIGILISTFSFRIVRSDWDPSIMKVMTGVFALHLLAAAAYWQYALAFGADSFLYYSDAYGHSKLPIETGTIFTVHFVQAIKSVLGGSYLDYFILFQSFGLIGIALVVRTLVEVTEDLGQRLLPWDKALLFLPGLHFWTSGIGKDAPLFLAVALSVWASVKLERRLPAMLLALLIMLPFRPHIAAIAVLALLVTLIFDTRTKLSLKVPLVATAIMGAVYILGTVQSQFNLGALDSEAVESFISSKQEYGMRTQAGAVLSELPLPFKIASLLFRPFFFDAGGAFGLVVSLENVVMLVMFGTLAVRFKTVFRLAADVIYVRYSLVFALTLIVLLSLVTYNVGLGLRQKFMVVPAVLVLFITLVSYRRALGAERDMSSDYDLAPEPQAAGQ